MRTRENFFGSEWPWLWREVRPFWGYQAANLCCIFVFGALMMAVPLLMRWVIDEILPARRWGALVIASILFFVLYVGRVLLSASGNLINKLGIQRVVFRLRTRLLERLQSLPAAFHGRHPVGELVQRLERDVTVVGELGSDVLPAAIRMMVETVLTLTAMAFLDWKLAALIAPLMPLFFHIQRRYRSLLRHRAEEVREASGRQSSLLNEILTGVIQLQLLGAERRLLRRYAHLNLVTMRGQIRQRKQELVYTVFEMSIIGVATALIIGYGGARAIEGTLSVGTLVAFYGYIGSVFGPMQEAVELNSRMQRVHASIRRLIALEQEPSAIQDAAEAVPLPHPPHVLKCRNASFEYSSGKQALRNVDFEASAGERIALVGESGGGKSTLLKLFARLYDPDEGSIEIDGRDIRGVQLRSLRQTISFVPQDPILFQGTVRDNLRHGGPSATPDEIAEAAWIACFADVVERLPKGLDTELGPMGNGLSGGERQRLAIARALLQRRPVLILDEATSALDPATEHLLLSRLERWCDARIVITASHRLSNAEWADRVVVINRGVIDGNNGNNGNGGGDEYIPVAVPAGLPHETER
jgi:ABC-type multidrug transport system fused ATPase/permease subunit